MLLVSELGRVSVRVALTCSSTSVSILSESHGGIKDALGGKAVATLWRSSNRGLRMIKAANSSGTQRQTPVMQSSRWEWLYALMMPSRSGVPIG